MFFSRLGEALLVGAPSIHGVRRRKKVRMNNKPRVIRLSWLPLITTLALALPAGAMTINDPEGLGPLANGTPVPSLDIGGVTASGDGVSSALSSGGSPSQMPDCGDGWCPLGRGWFAHMDGPSGVFFLRKSLVGGWHDPCVLARETESTCSERSSNA